MPQALKPYHELSERRQRDRALTAAGNVAISNATGYKRRPEFKHSRYPLQARIGIPLKNRLVMMSRYRNETLTALVTRYIELGLAADTRALDDKPLSGF